MDLRPLNPYYQTDARRTRSTAPYTYAYRWQEPVTDRTQADVDRLKELRAIGYDRMTEAERQEYGSYHKGALNKVDLERVENNVQILLDVLEIDATSAVGSVPTFPTESYYRQLHGNVTAIRAGYYIHSDTPPVPPLPWTTWQAWNALERILADVYEVLMAQYDYFAGELRVGDDTGLIL